MLLPIIPLLSALLLLLSPTRAADSKPPKALQPCTIISPTSGSFYDLNSIAVLPQQEGKKAHSEDRLESWHARGYDYGANFSINFCHPVVEKLEDVIGVEEENWKNISAFYIKGKRTYSIGQLSTVPVFRGRKLVLNYTNGSPCGENKSGRRKETIISLLCDRDHIADPTAPKATVAFVAASEDDCTYFFEARSAAACGGVSTEQQTVGPAGVFGLIALIAAVVYLVGGIAYQRTVMHQRGWKQIPNYGLWAGMLGFVRDMFIILTSSCARLLPSRRGGYNQLPTHNSNRGRNSTRAEDENRLIDQLDEEWDD